MTGTHDDMLEAVALLALGVLPAEQARVVADHARTCDACRAEYADLRPVADLVAYSGELGAGELDVLSSARLKASVMNVVRAKNGSAHVDAAAALEAGASVPTTVTVLRTRTNWLPYVVAVAAVFVAVLATMTTNTLRSQVGDTANQVAALQSQLVTQTQAADRARELETRLAELTAPDAKHFGVKSGEVVTSGGHVYMALRVASLAPGKVYQAWTLHAGAKAVAPSVTFVPDADGVAFVELPEAATGLAAVAVSVEPVGGSKAPTSTPAFVRTLS